MEQDGSLLDQIGAQNADGRSPLRLAVENGLTEATQSLINFGADANEYFPDPLLQVAISGYGSQVHDPDRLGVVRALVGARVDINAQNAGGWSALHTAVYLDLVEVVEVLIELGGRDLSMDLVTDGGQSAMDMVKSVAMFNLLQEFSLLQELGLWQD
ncbi:ankyrin repeat-containing domain protein [Phyllosticta citribraziliensis]|uniref:Ankyrin repeat-containing domain protein n=1 Tax=Phyllosticta citribraziliensis TaxID=989973 RepID=A0ABR1LG66_9PEZI